MEKKDLNLSHTQWSMDMFLPPIPTVEEHFYLCLSTFIHNNREEDAINRPVAECNAMD